MENGLMLTLMGKGRPGIVAEITQALFELKGNLEKI